MAMSPRSPSWQVCFVSVFLSGVAVLVDAVRVDGFAKSAVASGEVAGAVAHAMAPAPAQRASVGRENRDRELSMATQFVDAVQVTSPMTLSNIRYILYHFERLRAQVLAVGSFRDYHLRQPIRDVLRDIRTKSEVLTRLAAQKVSEGEVDDGGDALPSQRDNICNTIHEYDFDEDFNDAVLQLCAALDRVRVLAMAHEDLEAAVFEVSGRLNNVRHMREYELPHISWGIASMLSEERQWVSKMLGNATDSDVAANKPTVGSAEGETGDGGLSAWLTDVAASTCLDPEERKRRLQNANETIEGIGLDDQSLSSARTSLQRLELVKEALSECIACSEPADRERIREVMHVIRLKSDALEAQAELRLAAGEVDDVKSLLPSQRENICKNVDEYDLQPRLHDKVKAICASLDNIRRAALMGEDTESAVMEVVGRMNALRTRPKATELRVAGELEIVFTEEWRWLNGRGDDDSEDSEAAVDAEDPKDD